MLVLHISPVFPQDPNLSEWVSAWFIGGGNNGGGGWVLWFDSTPLVWIFLCALGPSSFWRWCDFWWQATKHRLQVDISRMATCVSGLTNYWLGGTGMAYSRFLAQKGRGWGGGRRSGRRTLKLFRWWLFPMVDITEVKRKHDPFGKCTCFQSALHCWIRLGLVG